MVGLGDLPGGAFTSDAHSVSADGSVVVGESNSANGNAAFIWDDANGMVSIQSLLTGSGVDLTGWILSSALGISSDGLTIVGLGKNPQGNTEAWIASFDTDGGAPVSELLRSPSSPSAWPDSVL